MTTIDLLQRRRQMMAAKPYDHRVEFIECTGTQYIDTEIYTDSSSLGYEYGMSCINDLGHTQTLAGWYAAFNADSLCMHVTGTYLGRYYSYTINWRGSVPNLSAPLGKEREYIEVSFTNKNDWDGEKMTMRLVVNNGAAQDVIFDNPLRGIATGTFIIGGVRIGSRVDELAHIKIYYFRLLRFDKPIADFIPVRVGDEGFLYDKISGKLFGNKGTGKFVLGPDI